MLSNSFSFNILDVQCFIGAKAHVQISYEYSWAVWAYRSFERQVGQYPQENSLTGDLPFKIKGPNFVWGFTPKGFKNKTNK